MCVLGTVLALLPRDSTLCCSEASLERMFQTLGLAFSFFDRRIILQTTSVHRMTDSLEIRTAVHVTSETWIPLPFPLFRFLRLAGTRLVW